MEAVFFIWMLGIADRPQSTAEAKAKWPQNKGLAVLSYWLVVRCMRSWRPSRSLAESFYRMVVMASFSALAASKEFVLFIGVGRAYGKFESTGSRSKRGRGEIS